MQSINPKHVFIVFNTHTGKTVESHATVAGAVNAVRILNEHEKKNARACVYVLRESK